jgi:hypothetical protein
MTVPTRLITRGSGEPRIGEFHRASTRPRPVPDLVTVIGKALIASFPNRFSPGNAVSLTDGRGLRERQSPRQADYYP